MVIKSTLSEVSVWVYRTYNRIYVLDINDYNDQRFTKIEPALLSSAEGMKQRALIISRRRHFSDRNNEKFIDRRSKGVATGQKIMNEGEKLEYPLYSYSSSSIKCKTII